MLGDLERNREIETTIDPERLIEPSRNEVLDREMEEIQWQPFAVDSEVIIDSVALEGLKPDSVPASEIDDTFRADPFDDKWHDRIGRTPCTIELPREELGGIGSAAHVTGTYVLARVEGGRQRGGRARR